MDIKSFAYIQNLRIPHEMAHSIAVVKAVEATGNLLPKTYLVHPKRAQPDHFKETSTYTYYDLTKTFQEIQIWVPELLTAPKLIQLVYKKIKFIVTAWVFALQAWWFVYKHNIEVIQTGDREILALYRLLGWIYKPKIIYDLHNDFADWYNKGLLRFAIKAIDVATVNCEYLKKYVQTYNQKLKTIIIPNGFDPKYYQNEDSHINRSVLKIPEDSFVFGYVGRFKTMGAEKGITEMLQAAETVHTQIPIHILIVGGPKEVADQYRQYIQDKKLHEFVTLIDQVPPSQVADYIKSCDVCGLLYPDTFHYREKMSPMKAIEYLAAGKPIIASDLPTIRHILNDFAEYVEPVNVKQIAKALITLYNASISDASERKKYVKQFTWIERQKKILQAVV